MAKFAPYLISFHRVINTQSLTHTHIDMNIELLLNPLAVEKSGPYTNNNHFNQSSFSHLEPQTSYNNNDNNVSDDSSIHLASNYASNTMNKTSHDSNVGRKSINDRNQFIHSTINSEILVVKEVEKRAKKRASPEQLTYLMKMFQVERFPSHRLKQDISKRINMPVKSVVFWYQNQRQKSKSAKG